MILPFCRRIDPLIFASKVRPRGTQPWSPHLPHGAVRAAVRAHAARVPAGPRRPFDLRRRRCGRPRRPVWRSLLCNRSWRRLRFLVTSCRFWKMLEELLAILCSESWMLSPNSGTVNVGQYCLKDQLDCQADAKMMLSSWMVFWGSHTVMFEKVQTSETTHMILYLSAWFHSKYIDSIHRQMQVFAQFLSS